MAFAVGAESRAGRGEFVPRDGEQFLAALRGLHLHRLIMRVLAMRLPSGLRATLVTVSVLYGEGLQADSVLPKLRRIHGVHPAHRWA